MNKILSIVYKLAYPLLQCYWYVRRPYTEGVRCVLRYRDSVLCIMHTYGPQVYTVPGGGISPAETPLAAVRREVWEEVGISIKKPELLGTTLYTHEYKKDTVHFFVATVSHATIIRGSSEIKEATWFHVDALPENIYPAIRNHIERAISAL